MRRVLIDTNMYAAFKRNEPRVVEAFRHLDFIGIDITVLAELYTGFKGSKQERRNRQELETFINARRIEIIEHDADTAEFYATIHTGLKKKGKPIPTNVIWIAAAALQNGLALFTNDAHFLHIEGLVLKTDY